MEYFESRDGGGDVVKLFKKHDQNYFPAKNPKTKAASPNISWSSQLDFGLPTSASFKARLVSSFSFSKASR
jgi:hypothetical protein